MVSVELLIAVFGLAFHDSVNPSALVVTLRLLATESPTGTVLAYLAGVFSLYLAVGVASMAGLGLALDSVGPLRRGTVGYGVQGLVGAAMLGYALLAPDEPADEPRTRLSRAGNRRTYFALGVTVTGLELSTALPYVAAVGLLTRAQLPPSQWLAILLGYNLLFVLPPLLLLVGVRLGGSALESRFEGIGRDSSPRHA